MSLNPYDYVIIGAGPAGLQLGYYLKQAGRKYLILEKGSSAGNFFCQFPRHRQLISINKVHTGYEDPEINLRWDWNSLLAEKNPLLFKDFSEAYFPDADCMSEYLESYAEKQELDIAYQSEVNEIHRQLEGFQVKTLDGKVYYAKCLIIATGLFKPYLPDIPGIEHGIHYNQFSIDPKDYINQKVLIIGKGNSGFETADHLTSHAAIIHLLSRNPVEFAWRSHFVGHLRAVNNNFLDTYQLKSQNAVLDAHVLNIEKKPNGRFHVHVRYSHANGEEEVLEYDQVLLCTGYRFDHKIFASDSIPERCVDDRFPRQTATFESTNIPDLYFAGTLTQMRDYRKTASSFVHGFRYNTRFLFHYFEKRYFNQSLPNERIDLEPKSIQQRIIARINRSSGLWQQYGFLSDYICVEKKQAVLLPELVTDFILEEFVAQHKEGFTVSLEYGKGVEDPFRIERNPTNQVEKAHESEFLHPIIRYYSGGVCVDECHLMEDLYGEWKDPEKHQKPLLKFLQKHMGKRKRKRNSEQEYSVSQNWEAA